MVRSRDASPEPLSDLERQALSAAGIALFAGRLILDAQPPATGAVLEAVAEQCSGQLPGPLIELWRTAFGGRLDYDVRADLGGQDVALSFTELFYPGSDHYNDLWGWIDREYELAEQHQPGMDGRLDYLPIGGFEYLERVYVRTAAGPGHGVVMCWQQGLPPTWQHRVGDQGGWLADDLYGMFGQLMLEHDPWEADGETGAAMRYAVDELGDCDDALARSAAAKLRRLVQATVLDWRLALRQGTLTTQRRLRRLALDRAAATDDVAMLARLVALGCDPAEEVGGGMAAIDVALRHESSTVVSWLLERNVPVANSLRVAAHAVDLGSAQTLLERGALVDASVVAMALDNPDVEVLRLVSLAAPADADLTSIGTRLRMLAAQERQSGSMTARQAHRSMVLAELAHRFDPGRSKRRRARTSEKGKDRSPHQS